MKRFKYLIIIVTMVILIYLIFLALSDKKLENAFNLSDHPPKTTKTNNVNLTDKNDDEVLNVRNSINFRKSNILKQYKASTYCSNKNNVIDNTNLTDKQVLAKQMILTFCEQWGDYKSSLSHEQQLQLENDFNDQFQKNLDKSQIFFGGKNPIALDLARTIMSDHSDDSQDILLALMYLFNHENQFIIDVSDLLGTKDLSNLKSQSTLVPAHFVCYIFPSECNATAPLMLDECLRDENACGLTFLQYEARNLTANQYSDLIRTLEIINDMTINGYFRNELDNY